MDELMAQLEAYDWGGDRGSLARINELVVAAQGDRGKLTEIEKALLVVLRSASTLPAKEYVCRQLALIGTARSVPVLAKMLYDASLSDCARLALEMIPDASVDKALRAALEKVDGDRRVGIVNTLGERRDRKAVSVLSELRNSSDTVLTTAVESALRKIESRASHGGGER